MGRVMGRWGRKERWGMGNYVVDEPERTCGPDWDGPRYPEKEDTELFSFGANKWWNQSCPQAQVLDGMRSGWAEQSHWKRRPMGDWWDRSSAQTVGEEVRHEAEACRGWGRWLTVCRRQRPDKKESMGYLQFTAWSIEWTVTHIRIRNIDWPNIVGWTGRQDAGDTQWESRSTPRLGDLEVLPRPLGGMFYGYLLIGWDQRGSTH